jgi:putative methyltransferase (TIGR04325 family)
MDINFSYLKTIIVWYLSYFRSRNKYLGHFSSFREAYAKCKNKGYKDKNLLNKIIDINKKVKAGEVISEQDGTKLSYSINNANLNFNILNLYNKKKKLIIIDFGGSLGNVYRNFFHFSGIKCNWNIIEQPVLVDAGKKFFKSPNLNFYTLKESIRKKSIILKKKRGGGGGLKITQLKF